MGGEMERERERERDGERDGEDRETDTRDPHVLNIL